MSKRALSIGFAFALGALMAGAPVSAAGLPRTVNGKHVELRFTRIAKGQAIAGD